MTSPPVDSPARTDPSASTVPVSSEPVRPQPLDAADALALRADLEYALPEHLVARYPPAERDGGRMLVVREHTRVDATVRDLPDLLRPGDLLVLNDTRVVPARLFAHRATGGQVEALLLPMSGEGSRRRALLRPGRRLHPGEVLQVVGLTGTDAGTLRLEKVHEDGTWTVAADPLPEVLLARAGHVPLPPYLDRPDAPEDRERYQTVYAGPAGAVAAPTAGLHLSRALLRSLRDRGVRTAYVTLHVGVGTFRPLRDLDLARGELHAEPWVLSPETAAAVVRTRAQGGHVVAVGTTSTRVLESAALPDGTVRAGRGSTRLFIRPGRPFQVVDRLLTNLHLPGSSLLALVHAYAGKDRVRAAYAHAIEAGYRFYSYGDAMLLDLEPPRDSAGARPGVDSEPDVPSGSTP